MKERRLPLFSSLFLMSLLLIGTKTFGQNTSPLQLLTESEPVVNENINLRLLCCSGGPPGNNNFANATSLTLGALNIAGNTCGATLELNENLDCNPTADQSMWYRVTATATTTYIIVDVTATGTPCYVGSAIWQTSSLPTGTCQHALSCQGAAYGPFVTQYTINSVIGTTYYIQITYTSGGVCSTGGCFNIRASNTNPGGTITNPPPVNTCGTPSSTCWFTASPTNGQIAANCTQYLGSVGPNSVQCRWLTFTNGNNSSTAVSQGLITSNCPMGANVLWWDWTLYDASCNYLSCGTLGQNLTGLQCNTTYNVEVCWETPNCTWSSWYFDFYAPASPPACSVLPIELLSFSGAIISSNQVQLEWETASELNNDHFTILRSEDGRIFYTIGTMEGAGTATSSHDYSFIDESPLRGTNYYRIAQTDFDGAMTYSKVVSVAYDDQGILIYPNPVHDRLFFQVPELWGEFTIEMTDMAGRIFKKWDEKEGYQSGIDLDQLKNGLYLVNVKHLGTVSHSCLLKN